MNHRIIISEKYNGRKLRYILKADGIYYQLYLQPNYWSNFNLFCKENGLNSEQGIKELLRRHNKKFKSLPLSISQMVRALIQMEFFGRKSLDFSTFGKSRGTKWF